MEYSLKIKRLLWGSEGAGFYVTLQKKTRDGPIPVAGCFHAAAGGVYQWEPVYDEILFAQFKEYAEAEAPPKYLASTAHDHLVYRLLETLDGTKEWKDAYDPTTSPVWRELEKKAGRRMTKAEVEKWHKKKTEDNRASKDDTPCVSEETINDR